jgi:fructose/tagatose bisphosphate aldolase
MIYQNEGQVFDGKVVAIEAGRIKIKNPELFRKKNIDDIVDTIILSDDLRLKKLCYWLAFTAGLELGVIPSSIQGLYQARGQGKISGFTVPAMNLRTLTYDLAQAIFRAAATINAGAFIFEIAKSEIGYTDQKPAEYTAVITLAALKENYQGPIFIQGDHFQVKAKNFLENADKEINPLKHLISEAVSACFYNIDIDTSTLVDLSKPTLDEQQRLNYQVCALFTKYIRQIQPKGIEISIGGEIGEVGGKNSTPEELKAFLGGYLKEIGNLKGISKISIQTGTSHGGVVLPDGSIAKVSLDFDTLKNLSEIAKKDYCLAGAVQHGASTLPNEAFHKFPEIECAEIHLATQFQNIVYDYLPLPLKEKIYAWLNQNYSHEKKPGMTNDQFVYKTRKNALGAFKKEIHSLAKDWRKKISSILEEEFSFLFDKLNIKGTKDYLNQYVKAVATEKKKEDFLKEEKELGELEGAD